MSDEEPKPQAPGWGTPATVVGLSSVVAVAIANIKELEPFLDRQGMNALIVLTGLGLIVTFAMKVIPAIERAVESWRHNSEKLTDNYHQQTAILDRMDQRHAVDSEKIDELHREVVVKRSAIPS